MTTLQKQSQEMDILNARRVQASCEDMTLFDNRQDAMEHARILNIAASARNEAPYIVVDGPGCAGEDEDEDDWAVMNFWAYSFNGGFVGKIEDIPV